MKFVYKLTIEYHGKNFFGSQKQGSLRTVEKVLYSTIKKFLNSGFELTFASRTDSGVHSLGNVVRLRTVKMLDTKNFLSRINHLLPKDLKVKKVVKTKPNFNPRKDVKYKVYHYRIYVNKTPPVLWKDYVWHIDYDLDFKKMVETKNLLEGKKKFDFATTKEYTQSLKSTVCNLKIKLQKKGNFIDIFFISNRFLHRMVRNLVSFMVEVSRGKISVEQLTKIMQTWQYCKIRPAPACGLVLEKIVY